MSNPLTYFLNQYHPFSAAAEKYIEAAFISKTFKEGEELSAPGSINKELFFIVNGILRIMIRNEKGNEVTHYFLKENQFCTILNSFHNQIPAEECIQAACNCEVLYVNRNALLNLYKQVPYLHTLIDQITQQALIDKINIRNIYLGQDSANRYRLFMNRQADVARRVSLTDTASYLGITPQSLSRIRKQI
ncbi:Crp/Fnr family transcriptional regulator [Pedobacter jeongneungensis]|uniref:Crp/Fnr family transcriptional regulator n=1 Tax=Pedobacter jeongneungensis TaxID=947309 RepID=UPI000469E356|nr:Crp/Fnr family transcriptional regulator [Pedobacter jeongneungensis]